MMGKRFRMKEEKGKKGTSNTAAEESDFDTELTEDSNDRVNGPESSLPSEEGLVSGDMDMEKVVTDKAYSALKSEVQENYDKYLRALAELENYKKRALKERSDLLRYAGEHLARDLLDVVDNLERAGKEQPQGVSEEFFKGIQMILSQFQQVLEKHGIKGEYEIGKNFDPEKHQAMTAVPTDDFEPGTIMEQFNKTYFFKDKLLRPAQVVVAKKPEDPSQEG